MTVSNEIPLDPRLQRTHIMGIGGAGMSGIARILLARGAQVSGSDAKESPTVLALRAQGAHIAVGHAAENIDQLPDGLTSVVISTAIRANNPELVAATERDIPVLHRAEALAALMVGHRVACIAGTHGKTSTTSMLTVALQHCALDPSFAIGGDLNESGANAHHGTGGIFVAEADESDGSFLCFSPSIVVVTNVEADHLDHHGTVSAYNNAFDAFMTQIQPAGVAIINSDDPGSAALAARAQKTGIRIVRYGKSEDADVQLLSYQAAAGGGQIDLQLPGQRIVMRVAVPGEHMASNAVAALLAGLELGAPLAGLLAGLANFCGVRRRFEFKGKTHGIRVYDDYAHHPTEVAAQLRAAREVTQGRIVVVFQPHLYSRTRIFSTEFGQALALADEVIVLDVYAAREEPEPGITGALIAGLVPLPSEHVRYVPSVTEAPQVVATMARQGDVVITMGAGDVTMLGPEILAAIAEHGTHQITEP